MSPLPWPLIGTVTPAPAVARPPVPPPPTGEPHDRSGTGPHMPLWLIAESAVLASLATAGGDLTAHQAVHQETR